MEYMLHARADVVVVGREKHLRLVLEPAERGRVEDPRLVPGELSLNGSSCMGTRRPSDSELFFANGLNNSSFRRRSVRISDSDFHG